MKVLIQDISTDQYFKGPFQWVKDSCAALNFENSLDALDCCTQMGERKLRVLMSFENGQQECLFSLGTEA